MDDREIVSIQIDRQPRSPVEVERRCHFELPVVIGVPPILDDGTPFPTSHWLTCPLATLRISRIESSGGVREADHALATDESLAVEFAESMRRYESERDAAIPSGWDGPRPSGGIAGSRGGVKCLHAQYADVAAGNQNPIGQTVMAGVGSLDCLHPCVVIEDGSAVSNPKWSEPAQ